MPYLKIETNVAADKATTNEFLKAASKLISKELGKPENYVLITLKEGEDLIFGGTNEPAAFGELKSLGLPENKSQHLSHAICGLLKEYLKIEPSRVYIEMSDHPSHLWGWNNSTF